jgi:ATP-binding cassette subfamily A (ABC1) protein 3
LRGINLDIVLLLVDGVLLFLLLVLIESKALARLWSHMKNHIPGYFKFTPLSEEMDGDVKEEQERVKETNPEGSSDILHVSHLQKKFRHLEAVRQLTFGVKPGECFGLLGINGAGKTTTFRMLTGDEVASDGRASILGHHLDSDRRRFLSQIGYCPQFDSIIPQLTGRELLRLMCRVRGVAPQAIEAEVERWTAFLGIQEYIDRQSGSYSGGNKRKLNVAMSLVGEPPLVFLDEPSTGVDPVARRNLWSIIGGIQRNGQSVVLTSHSMEECEALCDRLAIMVNGQFQCFGSSSHLKAKFGQGFTILTKIPPTGDEGGDEELASRL